MSVQDVLRLPEWERVAWKSAFEIWGPLDWRRDDERDAAAFAAQVGAKIEDCVLYPEPSARREQTVEDVMQLVGIK